MDNETYNKAYYNKQDIDSKQQGEIEYNSPSHKFKTKIILKSANLHIKKHCKRLADEVEAHDENQLKTKEELDDEKTPNSKKSRNKVLLFEVDKDIILPKIVDSRASGLGNFKSLSPLQRKSGITNTENKNSHKIQMYSTTNRVNPPPDDFYSNLFETYHKLNEKTKHKLRLNQIPTPHKFSNKRGINLNTENSPLPSSHKSDQGPTDNAITGVRSEINVEQLVPKKERTLGQISGAYPPKIKTNTSHLELIKSKLKSNLDVKLQSNNRISYIFKSKQPSEMNLVHEFNKGKMSSSKGQLMLHTYSKSIGELSEIKNENNVSSVISPKREVSSSEVKLEDTASARKKKKLLFCCF